MRTATLRLEDMKTTIINMGYVGENEHKQIRFDGKKMFQEYPNASVSLTVCQACGEAYPATIERDGDFVLWTITDSDLVAEGCGEIQLTFTESPHIAKSYICRTKVLRSLVPTGDIPSGLDDFITRADALLEELEDAIPEGGTTGQVLAKKSNDDYDTEWVDQTGGGGTGDYTDLTNKPQIGGVTLTGNKTLHDLGAATEEAVGAKYTKPSGGIPASDMAAGAIPVLTDLIDDTAGDGDTNKVWSADKSADTVQSVLSEIHSASNAVKRIDNLDFNLLDGQVWEMGSFSPSSSDVESNNKIRSGYIQIDGCSQIILSCDTGYRFYGLLYDENKAVISGSEFGWTTTDKYVINLTSNFQTAKYVRIAFQTTDQTASVGIESHMHGIYYDAFVNNLYRQFLLSDTIYGTTQAITKDSSGKVTQITHSKNNTVIRTDAITYGNGTITEVRTGFNLTVTITTNLSTLAVEVA